MAIDKAFRVVDAYGRGAPLLATDDWVEAERFRMKEGRFGRLLAVEGTHPSHEWQDGRCTRCGGWDNGSYGSHAPCGYDFRGRSLVQAIKDEMRARTEQARP